jgi:hypothetical protein
MILLLGSQDHYIYIYIYMIFSFFQQHRIYVRAGSAFWKNGATTAASVTIHVSLEYASIVPLELSARQRSLMTRVKW